jgi:hypothetical protein
MDESEVKDAVQAVQQDANQWAQRLLDAELGRPPTEDQMVRLIIGAAIILNALAQVAEMDEAAVLRVVSEYRKRVQVRDRRVMCDA